MRIFVVKPRPNLIDFVMHLVVGIACGRKFGWEAGIFTYSVVATLDQILWYCQPAQKEKPEESASKSMFQDYAERIQS